MSSWGRVFRALVDAFIAWAPTDRSERPPAPRPPRREPSYDLSPGAKRYFHDILPEIGTAFGAADYDRARELTREALGLMDEIIKEDLRRGPGLQLSSIPPLEEGGTLCAAGGDRKTIEQMEQVVQQFDALKKWRPVVARHWETLAVADRVVELVEQRPGITHVEIRKALDVDWDATDVRGLTRWLEAADRLRRERSGRTYALYPRA